MRRRTDPRHNLVIRTGADDIAVCIGDLVKIRAAPAAGIAPNATATVDVITEIVASRSRSACHD